MIRPDCLAMLWTVRPGLPNTVPGKQNIERMKKKMSRKLIIDGNAVYEIDEECMLKNRLDIKEDGKASDKEEKMVDKAEENSIK